MCGGEGGREEQRWGRGEGAKTCTGVLAGWMPVWCFDSDPAAASRQDLNGTGRFNCSADQAPSAWYREANKQKKWQQRYSRPARAALQPGHQGSGHKHGAGPLPHRVPQGPGPAAHWTSCAPQLSRAHTYTHTDAGALTLTHTHGRTHTCKCRHRHRHLRSHTQGT